MRTLLSQFCEEFDAIVQDLLAPLGETTRALDSASDDLSGRELRPPLRDITHMLQALAEKVAEQQAYVLIFGPLKSGKSTLMNALSASYVSEVSSLPAYPCMVYVSHAEKREYQITRYTGAVETFTDPAALHLAIHRAHGELAEQIRKADNSENLFDPAIDYPKAIRRVDFKLPAGELAESGAVMVDTPGLYSRMKFGYDRMTRDFRNAAACAIFVVKTDNLFLEQVFEEFNELLELFSRIFLVVNIDSTKRDLAPDGQLRPSLEQADPKRIIEAFETLAMSAPLKAAAEDGRLKIYPVDLLQAASERLSGLPQGATMGGDVAAPRASFSSFQGDLTDYLNSTEYLIAFLGDSLRRADSLMEELGSIVESPAIEKLRIEHDAVKQDLERSGTKLGALTSLQNEDWEARFLSLASNLDKRAAEHASRIEQRSTAALTGAVEAWFRSNDSLDFLNRDVFGPVLSGHKEELGVFLEKALREAVTGGDAGIGITSALRKNLATSGVDLAEIGSAALAELEVTLDLAAPATCIAGGDIPVKKGFWDWILFRGQGRVRAKLFGPANRPTHSILAAAKAKRLGKPGRTSMLNSLAESREQFFEACSAQLREAFLEAYSASALGTLESLVAHKFEGVTRRHADLQRQFTEHRLVLDNLDRLTSASEASSIAVGGLWQQYGDTDPHLLKLPLEGDKVEQDRDLLPIELVPVAAAEAAKEVQLELDEDQDEAGPGEILIDNGTAVAREEQAAQPGIRDNTN